MFRGSPNRWCDQRRAESSSRRHQLPRHRAPRGVHHRPLHHSLGAASTSSLHRSRLRSHRHRVAGRGGCVRTPRVAHWRGPLRRRRHPRRAKQTASWYLQLRPPHRLHQSGRQRRRQHRPPCRPRIRRPRVRRPALLVRLWHQRRMCTASNSARSRRLRRERRRLATARRHRH